MQVNHYRPPTVIVYIEGTVILGLEIRNITELIQQLEEGLEPIVANRLAKHMGLPLENVLMSLGISTRAVKMAFKNKTRVSRAVSQSLYRTGRIFERTLEVFHSDQTKAARWMMTPSFGLNNETPLRFARTEVGGVSVLELLEEIKHGGLA